MTGAQPAEQWASLVTSLAAHRPDRSRPPGPAGADATRAEVPVTLVAGFLGAGKSTLLGRLLADPGPVGIVRAVVNDIGRLPFDPTLVAEADGSRVELTNGCGCCLAGAAAELGTSLDRAAEGADLVVLEASGIADPAAVAQIVAARDGLRLDRIVAVADARSLPRLAADPAVGSILRRQLGVAEVVVVTHADGLAAETLDAVTTLASSLAPGCPVVASGLDDPGHRALTPAVPTGAIPPGTVPSNSITPNTSPPNTLAPGAPHGSAGEPIVETVVPDHPLSGAALAAAIEARPPGVLRGKGRLVVDTGPVLVQFTPSTATIEPTGPGPVGLTVVATDRSAVGRLLDAIGVGTAPHRSVE